MSPVKFAVGTIISTDSPVSFKLVDADMLYTITSGHVHSVQFVDAATRTDVVVSSTNVSQ